MQWLLLTLGVTPVQAQDLPRIMAPSPQEATAKHAVTGCRDLYVVKGGRVAEASVLASNQELDLAALRTTLKPYLSATFAQIACSSAYRIAPRCCATR